VDDRLWQPGPDIGLTPHPRRLEVVETEPRDRAQQIGTRLRDVIAVGRVPAQICLLHDVLGLRQRAEHAIGEAGEPPPMRLERLHGLVLRGHGQAACLSTGSGLPPTVSRVQALPWPSAYLIVG